MKFSPQTKWGEQSVALLMICCFLFIVARIVVGFQHTEPNQPLFSNLALDIPMLTAIITAIMAGITAIIAMVRDRERSVTVSVAALVGLLILFLVFQNLASPF